MVSCALRSCRNSDRTNNKKTPGVTFHRFPRDSERLKKWLKFVNRGNWKPSKWSMLCSRHFSEEHLDRTSVCCVRLRNNAVPTLYQRMPPSEETYCISRDCSTKTQNSNILCMYTFPYDLSRTKEWLVACHREDFIGNEKLWSYKICELHFEEKYFIYPGKRLADNAMPTIFSWTKRESEFTENESILKKEIINGLRYTNTNETELNPPTSVAGPFQPELVHVKTENGSLVIACTNNDKSDILYRKEIYDLEPKDINKAEMLDVKIKQDKSDVSTVSGGGLKTEIVQIKIEPIDLYSELGSIKTENFNLETSKETESCDSRTLILNSPENVLIKTEPSTSTNELHSDI